MKKQVDFVEMLFSDFLKNMRKHIEICNKEGDKVWNGNYMNKNHGRTALLRKITALRQELLNLEKMISKVYGG